MNISMLIFIMFALSSCATYSPSYEDVMFGAEFVTMGEIPIGKLRVSKSRKETKFCPTSMTSSTDKSKMKSADGSAANFSGFIDEAILKFMEEYKAAAIYQPKFAYTSEEYHTKLCGTVSGRVVRVSK